MNSALIDMSSGYVMGVKGFLMQAWEFYIVIFIVLLFSVACSLQILKIMKRKAFFSENEKICGVCEKVKWK
jgi:hypothetical protein